MEQKFNLKPAVKTIAIQPATNNGRVPPLPLQAVTAESPLLDTLGRTLRDLRISVTDRCNFRCTYCMPKDVFDADYTYLPQHEILSFEEIVTIARASAALGTKKIRLTGGEPLLRKNIEKLISMLRDALPNIDLTLTTNGSALAAKAQSLKAAGLNRVTVSLDALDDTIFKSMNDVDFPVAKVLEGIEAAAAVGLGPIKVNAVIKRGVNEDQIAKMVTYFRGTPHVMRFIEFMDVGSTNGWRMNDVVSAQQMLSLISNIAPIEPIVAHYAGEVAQRWRFVGDPNTQHEFGVIASVTQAFCKNCNRARISTDGQLFTCLFANSGFDLKTMVRQGASSDTVQQAIIGIWQQRRDRYSEIRTEATTRDHIHRKVEMSFIGG